MIIGVLLSGAGRKLTPANPHSVQFDALVVSTCISVSACLFLLECIAMDRNGRVPRIALEARLAMQEPVTVLRVLVSVSKVLIGLRFASQLTTGNALPVTSARPDSLNLRHAQH